jgi:integrase
MRRPRTYDLYQRFVIEKHIASSPLALIPLRHLRTSDLERYYADLKLAPRSIDIHRAVLGGALKKAVRDRLIPANPASNVERAKRTVDPSTQHARVHCWSAVEARRFLDTTKDAGTQVAAFFALALDTGARKSELFGLGWSHIDLDGAKIRIERQLDPRPPKTDPHPWPTFGPTKTGRGRTASLSAETVNRLRAHKQAQAAIKLRNRTTYEDYGLVFAREPHDLTSRKATLGQPMLGRLDENVYKTLVAAAGVRYIKPHGLRHTMATCYSLTANSPPTS